MAFFSRPQHPVGTHASLRVETLALVVSVFFVLAANTPFWKAALAGRAALEASTWLFAGGLFVALVGVHFVLLCLILNRWTAKPLLALLIAVTALAAYYMTTFTVFLDPGMLRNVLQTDVKEASELFSAGMLLHLSLYALVPLVLLARVRVRRETLLRAFVVRVLAIVLALALAAAALLAIFQDVAPLVRNHKEIRYLVTPANYLYSLTRVLATQARSATQPRLAVGEDAVKSPRWQQRKKPALFIVVVGETARAANWGLSGYARQTTPELAKLDVINFSEVKSCGTNTETSLPCIFSRYGRAQYDEDRIRNSESLLNVIARAGIRVIWRDNQSGCKGVCTGVEEQRLGDSKVAGLCDGERCLDEILLHGLPPVLAENQGDLVIVLHQLGNHGPAYYKRYPSALRRYTPVCETADLAKCTRDEVVNAYDNALLYTDHFLAETIRLLQRQQEKYDTALLYVSDHGESLGENGLYLHGVPYSIAPRVQTEVPMLLWFSPGYARAFGVDTACLRARARASAAHDNVFHSLLGLLDISTGAYDAALDLAAACRAP